MSAKLPIPVSQVIDLISSSPPRQHSPTAGGGGSLASSPLLPSPSAMLRHFVERTAAKNTLKDGNKVEKTFIWDVPNDMGELEILPPLAAKRQRATKTTSNVVKKPRARKTTEGSNVEKKVPLKDGKLKARVVKRTPQTDTKSKYFSDEQPEGGTSTSGLPVYDQQILQDVPMILDTVPKKKALLPKSPNRRPPLDPPLHVTRRQWTPVKDTALILSSSSPLVNGEPKKSKREVFGSIVEVMRYSTESLQSSREASTSIEGRVGNGLTKKRAIEMLGFPNSTTVTKEKLPKLPKPKLPKKKAKTITGQATAQYRSSDDPLLQYFSPQETPPNTENTELKSLSRKPGPPAKKKRKSDPELVMLLSPASARKKFDGQYFVFGTCSQLEKTDEDEAADNPQPQIELDGQNDNDLLPPPSTSMVRRGFLKTLAKERKGNSIFRGNGGSGRVGARRDGSVDAAVAGEHKQPVRGPKQRESQLGIVRTTGCGLWDAAARDPDGELMSVEVIDMTSNDSSGLKSENVGWKEELKARGLSGDGKMTTGIDATGRSVTHNDPLDSCPSIRRESQLAGKNTTVNETNELQSTRNSENTFRSITSRLLGVTTPLEKPTSTPDDPTTNPSLRISTKKSMISSQAKLAPIMPDFQSYLTSKLKAEVAKFGFKDMKTRDRMISCLERCWGAKNKVATVQSTTQQPEVSTRPVENTTRLPERDLNKDETAHVLQDEPAPLVKPRAVAKRKTVEKATPKSPRRKAAAKNKKSLPKTPAPDGNDDADPLVEPSPKPTSTPPTPRSRKTPASPLSPLGRSGALKTTLLYSRISQAVRESGQASSGFSFYHAILMYDPIILEDLTIWLNMRMDFEGENIDEEVVKAWCEANGVCCVRGESLRGGQRKRH